ncbi:pyruvate dehydrogenase complex dihydrolipoamide acetyltransferase [Sphingomonas sp. S17]|uniref:Acetyltransferase component of pyruvate dehydrogenase complex n=2 Tax=Sphingomonas paucimobilis TaxID=13689 RepID=A0A411LI50_SPHPI|nr:MULTISPECIES: pyruvate dehydrogenase complex dihydrolipoamide acetyltransferase [Sphingomonas]EGI54948.1 pyruvate dehydrogenase complex dihydrolipoamide acetyltransferase [Sphingomonas sp. S17]MBQ1479492.1 pyruvate dehydrogenase complex dihydrolipoamide acetyltransferase [Sphingomonas sp.]MDG5972694.1 pyruvate dehydrogenase complex dihydrolipoamide acetyltransferase [Sphingomonas paucimobilis]NNG59229.1 pyruvate dehydrogenase complex dihydrolipoamide acetyltransferase [Sphingomonas paucimobi
MSIEIKMPALSPTMEEGTLAKWLVKEGDTVKSGDIMAEIETDKATMEFEAVDEGVIAKILVSEGTDNVKVGTVIAILAEEGEDASSVQAPTKSETPAPAKPMPTDPTDPNKTGSEAKPAERTLTQAEDHGKPVDSGKQGGSSAGNGRAIASPLARRVASQKGLDLSALTGSGPNGRIVKADVENAQPGQAKAVPAATASSSETASAPVAAPKPAQVPDIPHEASKLSNMRKTIARRLTESKQQVPHIYLTVDVRLDALLKLRGELNAGLESRGVKLSVNDMLIKALGVALMAVPKCNVMFTPDQLISFKRADISVAVSTPAGLITPIVSEADTRSLSSISTTMKDLATRARDNKLQPHEFQGGTASISNMGMFGIKQFEAVINPPQGMILAIGAGEKRPYIVDDQLGVATVMSATGSFDHRAIDGADGAELMKVFKELVERPLAMLA